MNLQILSFIVLLLSANIFSSCGPAAVGGAAFGGYKIATDERSVGTIVDDSIILANIKSKMFEDEFVQSRYIDVDVSNGIVYLIGVVESSSQKRMAADIVRRVEGVRRIENQLVVGKTTSGQVLNDTLLTSKIRAELVKTPDIRSTNINVETNNKVVTLTGVVGSQTEKIKIHQVVQDVAIGSKIINNIKVSN